MHPVTYAKLATSVPCRSLGMTADVAGLMTSTSKHVSSASGNAITTGAEEWRPFSMPAEQKQPTSMSFPPVVSGSGFFGGKVLHQVADGRVVTSLEGASSLIDVASMAANGNLGNAASDLHALMSQLAGSLPPPSTASLLQDSNAVAQVLRGIEQAGLTQGQNGKSGAHPDTWTAEAAGAENPAGTNNDTAGYALRKRSPKSPSNKNKDDEEDPDYHVEDEEQATELQKADNSSDDNINKSSEPISALLQQDKPGLEDPSRYLKEAAMLRRPLSFQSDEVIEEGRGLTEDERRRLKRRIANRESARRVRQKRAEMLEELQQKCTALTQQNARLLAHIANGEHQRQSLQSQVAVLRERLLSKAAENNGMHGEIAALRKVLLEKGVNPAEVAVSGGMSLNHGMNNSGPRSSVGASAPINGLLQDLPSTIPMSSAGFPGSSLFGSAFAPVPPLPSHQGQGMPGAMAPSAATAAAAAAAAAASMLPGNTTHLSQVSGFNMM